MNWTHLVAAIIGLASGFFAGVTFRLELLKKNRPLLDMNLPCPACGHSGSDLRFVRGGLDPNFPKSLVLRVCKTCGCQVTHPPVAPALFERAEQATR